MIPCILPERPLYETHVVSDQEEGVDALIKDTIWDNLSPTFMEDMNAANRVQGNT